jgi:hypothetical protein
MYERDMEEEGKDEEGEGWGIGIKKVLENVKNGIRKLNQNVSMKVMHTVNNFYNKIPYKLLVLFRFLFLQGLMRLCLALAYCNTNSGFVTWLKYMIL